MSDIAKKLEDQLTCVICLEQYKDPRSLSCLHSFCTGCLERLPRENEGEDETISCPSCRTTTRILQGKFASLRVAFHINKLLEVQDLLQKSTKNEAVCINCPQEKAMFYCPECDNYLCTTCNDIHKKWRAFSSHEVMGIEEVANKATNMVSVKPTPPPKCLSHNESLKVYCIKCDQPICYLCTIKDHKGHDHTLVDDAYDDCKQKIREKLKLLEENVQKRKEGLEEMEESKKNVKENSETHKAMINQICDDFVEKIEKARHLGLQAVEGGMASYIASKDQLIKEEKVAIQALHDCMGHVECSLEKNTPIQLLLITKQIMERFKELVESPPKVPQPKMYTDHQLPTLKMSEKDALKQFETIQQKIMQDLSKSVLAAVSLQYPQMVYEQCEFVPTAFPQNIRVYELCKVAFALLFKGQPVVVDARNISCFLESEELFNVGLVQPGRHHNRRYREESQKKRVDCRVEGYFHDDIIKYRVEFSSNVAGVFNFNVKIGSNVINTEIKVIFQN